MAKCYDCGMPYGENNWIEAIIPDLVWNDISPNGDQSGILCISCMCRRLVLNGYKDIPVWLVGTEPIRPVVGEPSDNTFSMDILRNWTQTKRPEGR
jgi:hypothetical protein